MTDFLHQDRKRIPRTPAEPMAFVSYVLRHCSTRMKRHAYVAYVFEMVGAASDMLVSWVMGRIVGVIIGAGDMLWQHLSHELLLLAALWTLRNVAYRGREWMERHYVPELLNTTRELLFNRLIQQSQIFLHSNFAGVLANHVRRAGDILSSLRATVQHNIIPLTVRFVTAGFLLWQITPLFVVFVLVFLLLGIVCAVLTAPRWMELSKRQAEVSSQLTGYIVDSVTNLSVVQQNVGWREEQHRLGFAHDDMSQSYDAYMRYVSWFWGTFDLVMTFFYCGFMALAAYGWQTGHVTTAQLAMTIGVVTNLFGAIGGTVSLLSSRFFDDIGSLRDSLHKISTPLSVIDKPDAPDLQVTAGRVEFRDVTFCYAQRENLFSKLTLEIPAGQKVGLVGLSGAGKTTLCQLLLRSYDIQGGGIYIDGQNIAAVTQDSLHEAIAVIPQDPALFHRTLSENIRYGRLAATEADVHAAAEAAAVSGFIEALPQGYKTMVGERGVKLSGGQRQRVAIARAIVKNAPLLVLDEATSALDSETEKAIQAAMAQAMKGRTTLVIAHRLSTLNRMDRIIVMDQGRILEDGSFAELMAQKGTFFRLWSLQAGGFLPEDLAA